MHVARDGRSGIDLVRAERPDLVLLDLHLPDMNGETVLARLHDDESLRDVPVVVVTADASAGLAQRLTGLGARAVLTKPIDVGEVLAWFDGSHRGSEQS